MVNKVLCFAGLIRVSTERQEQLGESLQVQRAAIQAAVKQLGGKVVEWYGGQEHATPGWEKTEIVRLLGDARKKGRPWDAVIVAHADRWSRDNQASHEGLDVFKRQKVRFFVGATEYSLANAEHSLFLEMSAAFGKFQARNQSKKSIDSRVHRAKRGVPTAGKLPYGRTFDKASGQWGIDPEKKRIIEDAARRYLAGGSIPALAAEYGMNAANLHKVLVKRSGRKWTQKLHSDDLDVHEDIEIDIPELLPAETIRAIHEQVEANRTYSHGSAKNQYLLSRMTFCERCGYATFGQTNRSGIRYYRHAHAKRERPCPGPHAWARADELEDAVLRHLFNAFGNPAAVEAAIEAAIPDLDKVRELQARVEQIGDVVEKEKRGRQRIIGLVQQGSISDDEAKKQLDDSRQKIDLLEQERERASTSLANLPTAKQVKLAAEQVASKFKRVSKVEVRLNAAMNVANETFGKMTWEEKRDLVENVFSGKTADGQRMGVYLSWTDDGQFRYTIRGHLVERTGGLPMAAATGEYLVDPEYISDANIGATKYAKP